MENSVEQENNKTLKDSVFDRIESEKLCPRSKLYFKGKECLIWTLWLLSVILGSFAVAVTMFVVTYQQYALYEATHYNFFTYLVDVLPYLWLIVFILMVYVAFYNLRHNTSHGYRYPLWIIMSSSIFLSLVGGFTLQIFSLGHAIDNIIAEYVPVYVSQNKQEEKVWQFPSEGRLVGKQVFSTMSPTTTVIFEDISGKRWQMNVSELPESDLEILASGKTVKLLGKPLDEEYSMFHVCIVSFWINDGLTVVEDRSEDKKLFIKKLLDFAEKFDTDDKEKSFSSTTVFTQTENINNESVCGGVLPINRFSPAI